MLKLLSLALMIAIWEIAATLLGNSRLLPEPLSVLTSIWQEAQSGALFFNLGVTVLRVIAAFTLAMIVGSVVGVMMGRNQTFNRFSDPWLIVLLNLPALVIIVLAYIWIGLNEVAAIVAVALNKLPNTATTLREGARALDQNLEEMATVFAMPWKTRLQHVLLPQLTPYIAAATRSGLSLVWKIVLVVEAFGRPNGIGFQIYTAFQSFDIKLLLTYTLPFIALMLGIEAFVVQPFERHVARWRPKAA